MPVSGGMRVTPLPSGLELSAGTIDKLELRGTSGINSAVGASLETICTQGGIRNLLTSAEQLKIKSASANDTNSGSGHARRVKIKGIDGSGAEVEENVKLMEQLTTTNSYHVNDIFVNKVDRGGDVNDGDRGTTMLMILHYNAAGEGRNRASYAVPYNTNAYITHL